MALTGSTIIEVQSGGSDTNNSGLFDPSQTAGMFTDGAATSATGNSPVFTSASYTFLAGDVGAKVFIGSGTNWLKGWYDIVSVAGGAATLNATLGQSITYKQTAGPIYGLSIVAGCATTASPTGATWSIDYSQQAASQFTYTDMASAGAGLTVSSAAFPFAKQQVGNSIVVTGGTNFNAGRYVIASISGVTATVVGPTNITSGVGASGTGRQGGALASPGLGSGLLTIAGMSMFIKAATYNISVNTANVSNGKLGPGARVQIIGYNTYRLDMSNTKPELKNTAGAGMYLIIQQQTNAYTANLTLNGNSQSGTLAAAFEFSCAYRIDAINCPSNGIQHGRSLLIACSAVSCAVGFPSTDDRTGFLYCVAKSCTSTGFQIGNEAAVINCLAYLCLNGFNAGTRSRKVNCVAYGNTTVGIALGDDEAAINCIAEANGTLGFDLNSGSVNNPQLVNCAAYNNTTANIGNSITGFIFGFLTGSASFFTAAGSGDFSLNNTAGAGALLRNTGFPTTLPLGLTTPNISIGVAQLSGSGGGGGSAFNFAFS